MLLHVEPSAVIALNRALAKCDGPAAGLALGDAQPPGRYRVYDADGRLLGVGENDAGRPQLRPRRVVGVVWRRLAGRVGRGDASVGDPIALFRRMTPPASPSSLGQDAGGLLRLLKRPGGLRLRCFDP